jgi:outer membrane protein TolC
MNPKKILLIIAVASFMLALVSSAEEPLRVDLIKAIEMCLEYNWGIESARQMVKEAEGGVVSARAGFMPTLTAEASYTRLSEIPALQTAIPEYGMIQYPVFGPTGDTIGYTYVFGIVGEDEMSLEMGDEDNYVGRLALTQPLFTWGRTVNGYRLANHNLSAARHEFSKTEQDAVFNVARSYYSVLVAREFLSLAQESFEQVERHAESAARLYQEGKVSRLDLVRANVARENMRPQILKAENGVELATDGLKLAMGLHVSTVITVSGSLEYESVDYELEAKMEEARSQRPDLAALAERKEMAERALAIAQAGNKPMLVAMANYEYQRPYNFEDEWGSDWNATIALSIPLFDGFATSGESRRAQAQLEQVKAGEEAAVAAMEMEVKAAYLSLEEADQSILSREKNVEEAEEAHRIAERQFENGLLSNIEYLDAQVALVLAKANYIEALGDFNIARAGLERAVGSESWKGELRK